MSVEDLTSKITELKLNEGVEVTVHEEDATDDTKEYKFKAEHDQFAILVFNDSANEDDVGIEVHAGDFWQKDNQEYVPLRATIKDKEEGAIGPLESAKYLDEDGYIKFKAVMDPDDNFDSDAATDDVDELDIIILSWPAHGVERD